MKVYAGIDPVSKKRHHLTETVSAGPDAAREAEKVRTRLLNQVDERRNPRTRATVNQLLDRWLEVLDVEPSTRRGYVRKIDRHVRPVLGGLGVGRIDEEVLESFYAVLRRCRARCGGRKLVEHRTQRKHKCDEGCRPHMCRGLAASTIRQIHWILSGALSRAVRWKWIAVNPAAEADKPALPHPDPQPPSAEQAAQIVNAAWSADPDWGAFVWLAMVTGARRAELCALRWHHVALKLVCLGCGRESPVDGAAPCAACGDGRLEARGVLTLRRALYVDEDGEVQEKDTKTHQQRRVALDLETIEVLRELLRRCEERAAALELVLGADARVFSYDADGSTCWLPDTVTQRYGRLAAKLGIKTHLHALRHYSATEPGRSAKS